MKCPVCKQADLMMADRSGIEIDYCPQCRGVWLDRGELDKIIERSANLASDSRRAADDPPRRDPLPGYHRGGPAYNPGEYHGKRKRKGFLGELFDFD